MKFIYILIVYLLCLRLTSQNEFDASKIDPPLKVNADAVIRIHEETYKIKNSGHSSKYERLVVTVFNEKGESRFSCYNFFYSMFFKLKNIEGVTYDSLGNKLQVIRKSDIKDYSNFSPGYEITDTRQKEACFNKKKCKYPYTIEFSYEEDINTGLFCPIWFPIAEEHTGIERSVFSIVTPPEISFRYKEVNMLQKANIKQSEKEIIHSWSSEHAIPVEFEDYMINGQLPVLYTAPNNFEVENYSGNASSWKDIGKFYMMLNENRGDLPDVIKQKVKELVQNEPDTLKKIEVLYKYLQATTRYISIQLGIGGWQTIKAVDVGQKGYGDCKALSNYMIALLKEAGIKACPVLILADKNWYRIQEDFPCFKFNHMIACVPMKKDTLWLECTNQTNPMGYLGSFTGNRKALVINDDGGVLVNTITYLPKDNTECRKIIMEVNEVGDAHATIKTVYKGIRQEHPAYIYHNFTQEKQKEAIAAKIDIPRSEINHFSFATRSSPLPEMEENIELMIGKLIPKSGATIFITPNIITHPLYVPISNNNRKNSFYLDPLDYNYSKADTVIYNFTKEFTLESLPETVNIKSVFGEYTVTFVFKDNCLLYCRNLVIKGGTFPSVEYANWISFAKQINKNDKLKVVFNQK